MSYQTEEWWFEETEEKKREHSELSEMDKALIEYTSDRLYQEWSP